MIKIPPLKDVTIHTKSYSYFRGCDFTTDPTEIDESRSSDMKNMLSDDAGFPEKRIGWREMESFGGRIYGLHYAHFAGMTDPVIIVHHGAKLTAYNFNANTKTQILASGMAEHDSQSFIHGGYLYILDGTTFRRVTYSSGFVTSNVANDAKIPTTGAGGHYEAEDDGNGNTVYTWVACTPYEEPNLLTNHQKNMLAGDGVNNVFWLTERGVTISSVKIYGGSPAAWTATTAYTKTEDTTVGKTKITFTSAPAAHPEGAGIDNICVEFTSTENPQQTSMINKCCICTMYGYFNDNRVFISGNPDHKNRDWACGVDDPTYWEKNQWTDVGSDHTAIQGYLHYGDVLAIVKEDDNQDAEIYIRYAQEQSDSKVLFPVQQGVKGVGAISRGAFSSLRDDPLFFSREGVFAISGTDASQMRTVQNRSYFIDNKLRKEPSKSAAVSVVWNNHYLIAFPDTGNCYVADARMQTQMNESFVYEWFYWTNIHACKFLEFDGFLYFGTTDGKLCKMNSDLTTMIKYNDNLQRVADPQDTEERSLWEGGDAIVSYWTTRADLLGTMAHTKTLMKRGNTAQLKPYPRSSVGVYVISDNTNATRIQVAELNLWDFASLVFSLIDFNALPTPVVVPFNKKIKKFQFVQIRLENKELEQCFGILGVQLQYIINNYVK